MCARTSHTSWFQLIFRPNTCADRVRLLPPLRSGAVVRHASVDDKECHHCGRNVSVSVSANVYLFRHLSAGAGFIIRVFGCVLAMPRSSFTWCRPAHAYITHTHTHVRTHAQALTRCWSVCTIHARVCSTRTCTRLFARCESGYHTIKLGTHALAPNVVHHRPTAAANSACQPATIRRSRGRAARIWPTAASVNNPAALHWLMRRTAKPTSQQMYPNKRNAYSMRRYAQMMLHNSAHSNRVFPYAVALIFRRKFMQYGARVRSDRRCAPGQQRQFSCRRNVECTMPDLMRGSPFCSGHGIEQTHSEILARTHAPLPDIRRERRSCSIAVLLLINAYAKTCALAAND